MHEADFYTPLANDPKQVQCFLCGHRCRIKDGRRGICHVRENQGGKLYSLVYGRLVSENVDPIEKKPLFHLLPGSLSYSIATVGCNFRCQHCQNFDISQYPALHPDSAIPGALRTPAEVVAAATTTGCKSIAYTYIEPTIFMEFALETAELAHAAGIKNVFVSNGYTSPEATRKLAPLLDGNNIDLKAFTDKFYHEVCGAKLAPVLDTIRLMKELGVWVEVTTLVIPGWNDSDEELRDIAQFIHGVAPDIPWHVTRFHPTFKMLDRQATPVATLRRARDIGRQAGLTFVYEGNVPGEGGENTFCPACGLIIIERFGFTIRSSDMRDGACQHCGHRIAGVF
jgi:pyruvate formate lyase activating enzyme